MLGRTSYFVCRHWYVLLSVVTGRWWLEFCRLAPCSLNSSLSSRSVCCMYYWLCAICECVQFQKICCTIWPGLEFGFGSGLRIGLGSGLCQNLHQNLQIVRAWFRNCAAHFASCVDWWIACNIVSLSRKTFLNRTFTYVTVTCDIQVEGLSPGLPPLRSGFWQDTYTCVPLLPSSIIWCRPRGWSLWLGK